MEEDGFPFSRAFSGAFADESRVHAAREKSEELSTELKSITQLYNDYACRFELWEVSGPCPCSWLLQSCVTGRGVGAGGLFGVSALLGSWEPMPALSYDRYSDTDTDCQ